MKMLEHGTLVDPELNYRDFEIRDLGLERIGVDLLFDAYNPGETEIDTFQADYKFFLKDQLVVQGDEIPVVLLPQTTTVLTVPVDISYADLYSTASTLFGEMRQGKRKVSGLVNVKIAGEYLIYAGFGKRFTKPYYYEIELGMDIPLPEVSIEKVSKGLKKQVNELLSFELFEQPKQEVETSKPKEEAEITISTVRIVSMKQTREGQYELLFQPLDPFEPDYSSLDDY